MLRESDNSIHVTLIEYNKMYATGPGSNWVIAGMRPFPKILQRYTKLKKLGVRIIHDWVTAIDVEGKNLRFENGSRLGYDRLVVAPGIEMRWKSIEGLDAKTASQMPHAWQPGLQTLALYKRLKEMRRGGVVLIARPSETITCPPAFYERTSLVANWIRKNNPLGKVLLFDPVPETSLMEKLRPFWEEHFGLGSKHATIEIFSGKEARVHKVDSGKNTIFTGAIETPFYGDIVSVIPPQRAAGIAVAAGLTDTSLWCPVKPQTFESTLIPDIHVIGGAVAGELQRSAASAYQMAGQCAAAIIAKKEEHSLPPPLETIDERISSLLSKEVGFTSVNESRYAGTRLVRAGTPRVSLGEEEASLAVESRQQLVNAIWG